MVDRLRWSWDKGRSGLTRGLVYGPILGVIVGLISGLLGGLRPGLLAGLITALLGTMVIGMLFGLARGLSDEQIEATGYPGERLNQTFYNTISVSLIVGLVFGLIFGLPFGLTELFIRLIGAPSSEPIDLAGTRKWLIVGLVFGLSFGLPHGGEALFKHYCLRYFLIKSGALPRRLVPFLEHCVDLIFLRRVGGSYIFVHRLLMEHFAEMDFLENSGR